MLTSAFLIKREGRRTARATGDRLEAQVNLSGRILSVGPAPDGLHSLAWLFLSGRLYRNRSSHVRGQREPPSINPRCITVDPSAEIVGAYSHQFNSEEHL